MTALKRVGMLVAALIMIARSWNWASPPREFPVLSQGRKPR